MSDYDWSGNMRIILSRKGMDSGKKSGSMASPVMPDGTLLSLPIPEPSTPEEKDNQGYNTTYDHIFYKDTIPYSQIISDLSNGKKCLSGVRCHVDPDICNHYGKTKIKGVKWEPSFGQHGAAQGHLDNHKPRPIGVGDIFLFYGWFKPAEYVDGNTKDKHFRFITRKPMASMGKHIIWGYMEVGEVLRRPEDEEEIKERFSYHPHAYYTDEKNNVIYIPKEGKLSFDNSKDAYGLLKYEHASTDGYNFDQKDKLDLTLAGSTCRSIWDLGLIKDEKGLEISYNKIDKNADLTHFQSTRQGQEFIIEPPVSRGSKLEKWLEGILT